MRRVFPVQGYTGAVALHWGQVAGGSDLMAPAGLPVLAMTDGVVLDAGWGEVGGWNVTYQGDDGLTYYCAHLDREPAVSAGQRVVAGTYLAGVGDTGNAAQAGPHLHIGIGPEIVRGTGPYGGTGGDFDAVGLLRAALAGDIKPSAIPGFDFDVAEQVILAATRVGLPPLLMLGLAHSEGGLKRPFRSASTAGATARTRSTRSPIQVPHQSIGGKPTMSSQTRRSSVGGSRRSRHTEAGRYGGSTTTPSSATGRRTPSAPTHGPMRRRTTVLATHLTRLSCSSGNSSAG